MRHKRNSIVSQGQYQDGVRLGTVININGRFPAHGLHRSDCAKNILMYVMRGSGMIGRPDHKTGLSPGSVLRLDSCEPYYLKGQFAVYVMSV